MLGFSRNQFIVTISCFSFEPRSAGDCYWFFIGECLNAPISGAGSASQDVRKDFLYTTSPSTGLKLHFFINLFVIFISYIFKKT